MINGRIVGKDNTPVVGNTGGIWSLSEQSFYKKNSLWAKILSMTATGGTITDVDGYRYHTFTTSGTFTVTANPTTVNYLVVAGGGGAGYDGAGGGGAGGYQSGASSVSIQSYTITIGAGGAFSTTTGGKGTNGNNTTALGITSTGGGGGGSKQATGANGGSGGGGGHPAGYAGGTGTSGQGNNGGSSSSIGGGGGGGASAAGGSATSTTGGAGGNGTQWLNGTTYAGGGGGGNFDGTNTGGVGGSGGGGGGRGKTGAIASPETVTGAVNTGGGGGSNGNLTAGGDPGAGGSGIVIIRYPYDGPPIPQYEYLAGLAGKFFNGSWRSTISAGNIGTLPLTTTNDSSNVTGTGGLPSANHRYGVNRWESIAYTTLGDSYGFIAIGYFTPPTTGTYTFYTSSDDYSGVWIGDIAAAASGRTSANAVVNNGMDLGTGGQGNTKRSGTISLTAGVRYPIRIVHEEGDGGDNLTFSWSGPGIAETTNLAQYFTTPALYGTTTLVGNYV